MKTIPSLPLVLLLAVSTATVACGGATDGGAAADQGTGAVAATSASSALASASGSPGAAQTGTSANGEGPTSAGSSESATAEGGSSSTATDAAAPASSPPIDTSALAACPTNANEPAGPYVLPFRMPGVTCWNFTPADTGEPMGGENATLAQYAVRPTAPAPKLVLFLVGSGGHPSGPLKAGPRANLFAAAAANGNAVFAVSYKNAASIGSICKRDDTCYFPTRESILLGTPEANAGLTATLDESVVDRTARALRYLAAGDAAGNWASFLTSTDPTVPAAQAIDWTKIITVGHSQGGGHAAALGKLFPVSKVVQLSSTCDNDGTNAASWTDGTSGTWASDPSQFYGLGAPSYTNADGSPGGDIKCPMHTENWTHLGMRGAHRNNAAEICGNTGDTHDESLECPDNYPTWHAWLN